MMQSLFSYLFSPPLSSGQQTRCCAAARLIKEQIQIERGKDDAAKDMQAWKADSTVRQDV
jgi:hypothetical protein